MKIKHLMKYYHVHRRQWEYSIYKIMQSVTNTQRGGGRERERKGQKIESKQTNDYKSIVVFG